MADGLDILIEELNGSIWVAATDKKGEIQALEVDPYAEEVRWGSIYWAKVARIDKAMDAAFVNLDGVNIGLLNNADVRIKKKDGTYEKGGDKEIGKLIQPGQMIAVQAKSGYLPKDPDDEVAEDKNPRVSMNIVLPGRYLLHNVNEKDNRLSRRIRDKKMRDMLLKMMDEMADTTGIIMRAAAADIQTDILRREAKVLRITWEQMQEFFEGDDPALIMMGPDAIQRTLSDLAGQPIRALELTTMDHFAHAEEWCEIYAPDLVTKIVPVELPDQQLELGLFEYRDIITSIEELFQPYVILPDGNSIILQQTAALTAIDVNRGIDDRPALAINTDVAKELGRQLRLRNMGGAIVVDFLRMKKPADYKKLQKILDDYFNENDPCTVQVHGKTGLGFIELSRHRRTPPLKDRFESTMSEL